MPTAPVKGLNLEGWGMETSQEGGTPPLLKQKQGWQAWGVLHGCVGEAAQFGQVGKGRT